MEGHSTSTDPANHQTSGDSATQHPTTSTVPEVPQQSDAHTTTAIDVNPESTVPNENSESAAQEQIKVTPQLLNLLLEQALGLADEMR